jgi:hypothetical protein
MLFVATFCAVLILARSLKIRKYLFTFSQGRKIATIKWSRTQTSFGIFWRRAFLFTLCLAKTFHQRKNNNGIVSM